MPLCDAGAQAQALVSGHMSAGFRAQAQVSSFKAQALVSGFRAQIAVSGFRFQVLSLATPS